MGKRNLFCGKALDFVKRSGVAPAHHPRQHTYFEKRDELFLRVDLALSRRTRFHAPRRAQNTIAVECQQAGEEAGPRRFRRRLQREHLHMAFAHLEVIAVPCDRAFHDLTVHARIAAELIFTGPFVEVE